jgi:hypothetical protein
MRLLPLMKEWQFTEKALSVMTMAWHTTTTWLPQAQKVKDEWNASIALRFIGF